jgi:hypothetical protein
MRNDEQPEVDAEDDLRHSAFGFRHSAERLCTACGMCCNGVLFEIVRLQPQDSIKELEKLGMQVNRRKTEPYFKQPCRMLDGCSCTIYEQRPTRCRRFECCLRHFPHPRKRLPEWYQQVVRAADLAENSEVRGCMVIKPWGYGLWENIQRQLDVKFKATGHVNAYFPLLIPLSYLEKEASMPRASPPSAPWSPTIVWRLKSSLMAPRR